LVVNILPFTPKVKKRSRPAQRHASLELEVIFCVYGVISPLLANLYFRRFMLVWYHGGHARRLQAEVVNYADDFVILCREGSGEEAMATMRRLMSKLGLTVNEKKTRLVKLPDERFDFLGYTVGWC
jgi:RNA-directed DNA polymerase